MISPLRFEKMSGAGNDFVVLDGAAWESLPGDRASWIRAVCRRGLSVGADGVLVVSREGEGRVRVVFFNPDGGEAFCGNGSRCAARYAAAKGMASASAMLLATSIGEVPAVVSGPTVQLTLPPPEDLGIVDLDSEAGTLHGRLIVAGVPHVVFPAENLGAYPLDKVAPALRRHPALGAPGANVNFVEIDVGGRVHVRTWERGVENETLACGTGAVAVALFARLRGAGERVVVVPRSGSLLTVSIPGDPAHPKTALLSGDARVVFAGSLSPEAIANA